MTWALNRHKTLNYQRDSGNIQLWKIRTSQDCLQRIDWSIWVLVHQHWQHRTVQPWMNSIKVIEMWNGPNLMYNLGCRVESGFQWFYHSWLCDSCSCCVLLKSSENSWTPGDSGCSFLRNHSKRTTAQPYLRWCLVCLYGIWHMALLSQFNCNTEQ